MHLVNDTGQSDIVAPGATQTPVELLPESTLVYLLGSRYCNTPRIGRVLIARGRDACDVALASTFGPNTLERFKVWTEEVAGT